MRAATPLEARLLRRAVLACLLTLVSATSLVAGLSPGSGLTGECDQGLRLGAFDGDFMAMLQGSYGQLGQYDLCQEYGRYCTLQLKFHCTLPDGTSSDTAIQSACGSTMNHVPTLSVCVPKTCTVATLNEQLQSAPVVSTAWWSLLLQTTFNLNGLSCLGDVAPYQSCLHNASFTYFSAVCLPDSGNPDREHWGSSPGPRAAVYVIGFFVVLCGAATLVGVGRSTLAGLRIMLFPAPPPLKDGASDASDASHTAVTAPLLGAVNHQTPASHDNAAAEPRRRPSLLSRLLAPLNYFNVVDNWYDFVRIVPRHNAAVDTRWMEGLRVISMCFVVYGHTLYFADFAAGFANPVNAFQFVTTYGSIGVYPAELAVDAFFFMSGYLFLYLYFNQVEKVFSKAVKEHAHAQMDDGESEDNAPRLRPVGVVDTLLMYVHRYLRIAPVVGLVMLFTMYAAPLIPSGPLHGVTKHLASQCERDGSWWRVLLFFQNIRQEDIMCMAWFWYLSCDFQMFLFAPIVCAIRFLRLEDALWFSVSWRQTARGMEAKQPWLKKAGHVLFYLATLTFIAIAIEIASRKNTYQSQFYSRSIARAGPYAYGFLFAALIREPWIRQHLDSGRVRFALYTAGTFALLLSVNLMWKAEAEGINAEVQQIFFGKFGYPMPAKSLLNGAQGCAQAFFGLGLGLFSLAWGSGHGGPLAHFLGHPLLSIVSKLTFCSYMLHPIIIVVFWSGARALPVWTVPSFYGYAACFLCWTFLSATVLHLGVEVPAAKLNNALTKRR